MVLVPAECVGEAETVGTVTVALVVWLRVGGTVALVTERVSDIDGVSRLYERERLGVRPERESVAEPV